MDEDEVELIICRECEQPTSNPPDELIEFTGLCPGCVVKQEILPKLEPRFSDLIESLVDAREEVLLEKLLSKLSGVAVVINADPRDADPIALTDKVMAVFKNMVMHSQETRDRLRELLDAIDKNPPLSSKKKPIVRNDPRTG